MFVANLSPVPREGYRLGLPRAARWQEAINTDSTFYGGSDVGNLGGLEPEPIPWHGQPVSALVTLPPLAAVWLVPGIAVSFTLSVPVEFGVAEYPWERPLGARPRSATAPPSSGSGRRGPSRSRCG